jgi:hypothetical protein
MGRPSKLSGAKLAKAKAWAAGGVANNEIARRLGVHPGTVGRRLKRARRGEQSAAQSLGLDGDEAVPAGPEASRRSEGEAAAGDEATARSEPNDPATTGRSYAGAAIDTGTVTGRPAGSPLPGAWRIEDRVVTSRYAGAMLLHPFLQRLGVAEVLGGLGVGPARRYDATSLVLSSVFGFALGISSVEGAKHLRVADAGALVGVEAFPHLRTLRPRLKALAEACDPLTIQRSFAASMLDCDERPPELFYIDDHFVTYWGSRPVAKGYNIRRHLAEPGRDDTFVVDDTWRAICFSSGEPRGLSVSLPEVLVELKAIVGDRLVMVGFDRGGSYPKVFSALAAAGMDWVTWRRAPLVTPGVEPRRSWVDLGGKRRSLLLADEVVALKDYDAGPVRQLSSYEDGKVAFQVLTSNQKIKGAPMIQRLRGRWCIENTNKYLEDHQGIHWMCTYEMDSEADITKVANPARREARATLQAAKAAVADAERALGQAANAHVTDVEAHLKAIAARRDQIAVASDDLAEAKAALKTVPAKLPRNQLDPDAQRAKPCLAARTLQMVCRLLAYNAELDLARQLNNYLADPDEYRAITRNLLHLDGQIAFQPKQITVTLDRPDSPRIANALRLLLDQLAAGTPVHLAGDRRPITYQIGSL